MTRPDRPRLLRWALVPAVAVPVAMIGGWTVAGALQPGFDPVRETISALAATTADRPAIMTAGLAVTGLAHVLTAVALRPVGLPGRVVHALGGLGTLLVALLPVDVAPRPHGLAAGLGFVALTLWPLAGVRRGGPGAPGVPRVLRWPVAAAASGTMLALLGWFVVELQGLGPDAGAATGLAERAVAGTQALWPLVVVLALRSGAPPVANGGRIPHHRSMHPDVIVTDVPAEGRFEARTAEGALLGFSAYVHEGDAVVFTHTEVDEAAEGAGVGSQLVRGALDQVRAAGHAVVPLCPFVTAYIESHPEYADLVHGGSGRHA